MEYFMYYSGRSEAKAVDIRRNDLRDLKRVFSLRGKFSRGEVNL